MFYMLWLEDNKLKQKGMILFKKGSWLRQLTAKLVSVLRGELGEQKGTCLYKEKMTHSMNQRVNVWILVWENRGKTMLQKENLYI